MASQKLEQKIWWQAALVTLLLNLGLALAQIFLFSNVSYLGFSSPGLSSEISKSYPWVTFSELGLVFAYGFFWLFIVVANLFVVQHSQAHKRFVKRLAMIGSSAVFYAMLAFGSALKFPALYEGFLAPSRKLALFKSASIFNPHILIGLGYLGFLLLILRLCLHAFAQRKALLTLILFLTAGAIGSYSLLHTFTKEALTTKDRPNILLIGIDSLRTDKISPETTPEIISFKKEAAAVSFEDHIVGIPRTFPSWIEILQGRYSARAKIRHMFPGFIPRRGKMDGLPAQLERLGYENTVVSDFAGDIFPRFQIGYHQVDTPNLNISTLIKMNVDQLFPFFLPFMSSYPGVSLFGENLSENPAFADPNFLGKKAISYMEKGSRKKQPFFLTLFYSTAHFPYASPWPWYSKFSPLNYDGPFLFQKNPDLRTENRDLSSVDIQQIQALYGGALGAIDQSLSSVFNWLKENALWDNTLIIMTADHGEDLLEFEKIQGHGDHLKGEQVLRVPFIAKLTKAQEALIQNKTINFTTRVIDFTPTILALLGDKSFKAEGLDLSPWIFEKNKKPAELAAYSETEIWFSRYGQVFFQKERLDYPGISELLDFDPGGSQEITLNPKYESIIVAAKHRSLIRGPYKMIYTPTPKGVSFKLYHRPTDPFNQKDLAEVMPEIFANMKQELKTIIQDLEPEAKIMNDFVVNQ